MFTEDLCGRLRICGSQQEKDETIRAGNSERWHEYEFNGSGGCTKSEYSEALRTNGEEPDKKNGGGEVAKESITHICIDDFAMKKRETYGTVMIDIPTRRIIDMIGTRECEPVTEF